MNEILRSLSHFGGLIRGHPPVLSPTLDEFELMQYMRRPLKPAANDFRILLNVSFFQPYELDITVVKKSVLEIRARHERKQNSDGLWMTRDCTYKYELPQKVRERDLQAQWFEDDYLMIQATSSKSQDCKDCKDVRDNKDEKDFNACKTCGGVDQVYLVPKRVRSMLKPTVEMRFVREMIEEIRDKSMYALRYIRFHTHNAPCPVEQQIQDTVDAASDSVTCSSSAKE